VNYSGWTVGPDYKGPIKWEDAVKRAGLEPVEETATEQPVKRARKAAKPRTKPAPVVTIKVDPAVLRTALELAGGDASRLIIQSDGSVVVTHRSKRKGSDGQA
jgi:hypothetical protein